MIRKKVFYKVVIVGMLIQQAFPLYGNSEIPPESEIESLKEIVEKLKNQKAQLLREQEEKFNKKLERYKRKSNEKVSSYISESNSEIFAWSLLSILACPISVILMIL